MADINTDLLKALDGAGPQFKDANSETLKWWEGDKAPYSQIVDINGVPFSKTNPIPTSATGSNVDLILIETNFTVLAGGNSFLFSVPFAGTLYTAYSVGAVTDAPHTFNVQNGRKANGEYLETISTLMQVTSTDGVRKVTDRIGNVAEFVDFRINNTDTVDHTYNLYVIGYKGT